MIGQHLSDTETVMIDRIPYDIVTSQYLPYYMHSYVIPSNHCLLLYCYETTLISLLSYGIYEPSHKLDCYDESLDCRVFIQYPPINLMLST